MGTLSLEHITKYFGDTAAVNDVSLTIADGEFISFLGPSGCGKTTLLRIIAGFVRPTEGIVRLGSQVITSPRDNIFVHPEKRTMGMVFQSYAVWPHMNVGENVGYPLKFKHLSRTEIAERVRRVLDMVELGQYPNRYPHQLSGGQQQRVALARALVMEPEVLLLDEPLSNLDAKLREGMRDELVKIQRRLHMTVVYVTHDRIEAMAMSDRVLVIRNGCVLQVDSPRTIYEEPSSIDVANFTGQANLIPGRVEQMTDTHCVVRLIEHEGTLELARPKQALNAGDECFIMVRPENMSLQTQDGPIPAIVQRQTFLGNRVLYELALGKTIVLAETPTTVNFAEKQPVRLSISQAVLLKPSPSESANALKN